MAGEIFELLCCICSCFCDDNSSKCCFGTIGCLGILCASYKKNISGNGRRRFQFLNKVILFIFSIVAIVLSTITVAEFNSTTFNFSTIFQNWRLGAIIDIKVQDICDYGYKTLSIYKSPKTVQGCVCNDDITQGDCNYQNITGCTIKAPQDPLIVYNWVQKGNDFNYLTQICGKRSKVTFYQLIEKQIITEQDCIDNGYKVCKTNNIENSYCVLQDEDCPVRDVKISEVELSYEEISLKNYEKIYDQGFYIYLTRNLDIFPIVNFAIVKGDGVCLDNDEISLNARLEEDYKLLSPSPSNCELDDSYKSIAEITEEEFFNENGVLNTVTQAWPHYEISSQLIYKLMLQNQQLYRLQCRKSNFESLNSISNNLDSLKQILIFQTIFAYIFSCIITFLLFADLVRVCYNDCKCIKKYLYLVVQLTSLYLMTVTVIVSFSYIEYIKPKIQVEFDKVCFQKSAQSKLKYVLDQINYSDQTLNLTSSLFIICVIVIIIDFFMQTYLCYENVKKYRLSKSQQTTNKNNNLPKQDPFSNQEQIMYHNQQINVNSNLNPDEKQNFQNQQDYNHYQIPLQINYNYPYQNNNYISDNQYINPQNQQNQISQQQEQNQQIQF